MRNLKSPKNPPGEQFMGFAARNIFTVKRYRSPVRGMDTCNHVEERGLSGAVWPDQSGNAPLFDRQRSVLHGVDAAEVFVKVLNVQQLK